MAINVADNFSYKGSKPLDARIKANTVSALVSTPAADLYDGCFAYVTETKKYYSYDSTNTSDPTLGKWREFQQGGGGASALDDLTDVELTSPSNNQVLKYNANLQKWVNDNEGEVGVHINMSDIVKFLQQNANVTSTSNKITISANTQRYFGCRFYILQPIDMTNVSRISYSLNAISRSSAATQAAHNLKIGLMQTPPTEESSGTFAIVDEFTTAKNYGLCELDTSLLVGNYYFSVIANGWNAEIDDLIAYGADIGFANLADVNFTNLQNGQIPKYNSQTGKWENVNESGGGGSLPAGGTTGQSLVKHSDSDNDAEWFDVNKTISFNDFNELTQEEKDNGTSYYIPDATVVSNLTVMGNRFDKANIYTTDERMIGRWIDGKPLYQKVFVSSNAFAIGTSWINTGWDVSFANVLVNTQIIDSVGQVFCGVNAGFISGNLGLQAFNTISNAKICILQYTKTTDTTVNIGTDNDYSTDEQIIGTWIDGKLLYQKTVCNSSDIPSDMESIVQTFYSDHVSRGKASTLTSLIPVVTGPVSNISYSSTYRVSDYDGWYAFDSDPTNSDWSTSYGDTESWLQWTFDNPIYIDNITIRNKRSHADRDSISKVTIFGLNVFTNEWETLLELVPSSSTFDYIEESINNAFKDTLYKAVKVQQGRSNSSNKNAYMSDFRVNGYEAQEIIRYTTYQYTKTTD